MAYPQEPGQYNPEGDDLRRSEYEGFGSEGGSTTEGEHHETPVQTQTEDVVVAQSPKPQMAPDEGRSLLEPTFSDQFQRRWQEVQSGFVDDPYETLQQAKQLAEEAVNTLTSALTDRKHGLDARWENDKDTEELRQSLRGYRDLVDRIVHL